MHLMQQNEATYAGRNRSSDCLCPFCGASFSRSDAARRHTTTCPMKKGRPMPLPLKRGRRLKACDFCALAKNGCDGEPPSRPCSACSRRGQPCTYGRRRHEKVDHAEKPQRNIPLQTNSLVLGQSRDLSPAGAVSKLDSPRDNSEFKRIPISFLLRYTDPRNESIQEYFPSTLPNEEAAPTLPCRPANKANDTASPAYPFGFYEDTVDWSWNIAGETESLDPFLGLDFLSMGSWEYASGCENITVQSQSSSRDASLIEQGMLEVLSALRLQEENDDASPETSSALLDSAQVIFSPTQVDMLVQSYFDSWHPHCPILHRPPSFDSSSTFTPLLAAVMMIGATYSSREVAEAARLCLNSVETYVFEHQAFQDLLDPATAESTTQDVAPLQAAFIITILQHWHDHHGSRRRVRLHRYADVISAARSLGLPSRRHSATGPAEMPTCDQEWKNFFQVEEAVRLMSWIFLVDSSHAIFHRTPPKLALSELTGSLPCADDLFSLPYDSPQLGQHWHLSFPRMTSIARGMSLLMQDTWAAESVREFGNLGYQDLFILISGLHEIIFSAEAVCSLAAVKDALHRALARWEHLWDLHKGRAPKGTRDRPGFYENAGEYWWLAKLFLEKDTPSIAGVNKAFDQDSMREIHDLVKGFTAGMHIT